MRLILALAFLLVSLSSVAAQEPSPKFRRDNSERPLEIREIKTQTANIRSHVATVHANRLERRFKFYFDRLTQILNRFQTRLDKLKAAGQDTTSLQTKLDTARAKLLDAKTRGEQAVASFRTIDPAKWNEQKPELLAARDQAMAARAAFKEVHSQLKDALKLLKTLSKPALPAASPAIN